MSTQIAPAPLAQVTDQARRAQAAWAERPLAQRLKFIRRLRDRLFEHVDALCEAAEQDLGRTPAETISGEIFGVAAGIKFLEKRAAGLLRTRKVSKRDRPLWLMGQTDYVARRPRGVVGIIGTWNYPIYLNAVQITQALAAGNAVIWKPSEVAPHTAAALTAWLKSADLPEGLFQQLAVDRDLGKALSDAEIDFMIFTGHANTGRLLAAHLGRRLIPCTLELSGCDAMFLLDDADPVLAAKAAWFSLTLNNSQTCIAARRCFVHRKVYDAFIAELRNQAAKLKPLRMATPGQISTAEDLIDDAVSSGARLLVERPTPTEPNHFCPAILVDVEPGMGICRRDTFAPLIAVLPYDDLDSAISASKECEYDLGASVFTRTEQRGVELAEKLGAGMVTINELIMPTAHPATPFGGRRSSGWGSTQGAEGLLELTVPQVISIKRGNFRPHYEPVGTSKLTSLAFFKAMYQWQYAPRFMERLRGFFKLLGAANGKTSE